MLSLTSYNAIDSEDIFDQCEGLEDFVQQYSIALVITPCWKYGLMKKCSFVDLIRKCIQDEYPDDQEYAIMLQTLQKILEPYGMDTLIAFRPM